MNSPIKATNYLRQLSLLLGLQEVMNVFYSMAKDAVDVEFGEAVAGLCSVDGVVHDNILLNKVIRLYGHYIYIYTYRYIYVADLGANPLGSLQN